MKNFSINIFLIILGAAFTLCFAPFRYFAVGFLVFPVFFYFLLKSKNKKQAFWRGWLFGMGHHVSGLYWVANSMLVEADKFAWMIPFAVLLLPAYLSIYIGISSVLAYKTNLKFYSRIIYFAGVWCFAEIARTFILTGFPWNLAGMSFIAKPELASFASIIGVYGLSFFAVLFFTTPYLIYENLQNAKNGNPAKLGVTLTYFAPILAFLIFSGVWGQQRFSDAVTQTKLRIVQPSIPQGERLNSKQLDSQIIKYQNLSVQPSLKPNFGKPEIIIWPEAALPVYFAAQPDFVNNYLRYIIEKNQFLLLGTVRLELEGKKLLKSYNSLEAIEGKVGLLPEYYDKTHLVPFGEYIPLRSVFPQVNAIAQGLGDFDNGIGNKTLKIADTPPFITLICYEIVYSNRVAGAEIQNLKTKPEWILNITNDAWFGNSTGPQQHLDISRMRAIESGLPVIRAANNGISAVIDSYGRILETIKYDEISVIDDYLPKPAKEFASGGTFYSQYGLKFTVLLIFGILAFVIIRARIREKLKSVIR
jgi:apolipoprotein N-acyltransferase